MSRYEVIVESVGKVHETQSEPSARAAFGVFAHRSKFRMGACAAKNVSLWKDGEQVEEYVPTVRS